MQIFIHSKLTLDEVDRMLRTAVKLNHPDGPYFRQKFRRARAGTEAPSPARPEQSPKEKFVFLLEGKIGRAQIKDSVQNFSLGWRALASGGGVGQFSRSKKVRAID